MHIARLILLISLTFNFLSAGDLGAMIYRTEKGGIWDPSILWHGGRYRAFTMYRKEGDPNHGHCFYSSSEDGVHWREEGVVLEERERAKGYVFFKCMVARCGDRFIMNHGVALPNSQDILRFYESADLRNWHYLFSCQPDPPWYGVAGETHRWDHMYMLPKEEGNPKAGYWGFPVSAPKPFERGGVGRMQSADGRAWEVLHGEV